MPTGKAILTSSAFLAGAMTSAAVTALVPESHWKGLLFLFLFPAAFVTEKFFGAEYEFFHRWLTYGLAAILHGLAMALVFFLIVRFVPRLSRRGALISLAALLCMDIVFLIFVSPMRELP